MDHTSTMITVLLLAFLAGLLMEGEGESMVWTVLTVVQQLEFAALFVLCFLMGIVCGKQ